MYPNSWEEQIHDIQKKTKGDGCYQFPSVDGGCCSATRPRGWKPLPWGWKGGGRMPEVLISGLVRAGTRGNLPATSAAAGDMEQWLTLSVWFLIMMSVRLGQCRDMMLYAHAGDGQQEPAQNSKRGSKSSITAAASSRAALPSKHMPHWFYRGVSPLSQDRWHPRGGRA